MSVANGLQMSWEQFHVRCGSVLCLQFGKDIGLPPDLAPGVLGTFQLQITIQYTNPISSSYDSSVVNPSSYFPSGTKSWTPWVVVVSEGTLTIHNQRLTRNMGVLSRSDVVAVSAMPDVHVVPYEETDTLYGGSFLSGLKSLAGRVFNGLKDSGLLSQGRKALVGMLPVSGIAKDAINNVADSVGLGATGGLLTGMIDADEIGGGRKKKAPAKKRVMRGGRIMSRKELMAQLSE